MRTDRMLVILTVIVSHQMGPVLAQTTEAPMLAGTNGWQSIPKFTVGETITGWSPPGKLDGMGARRVGDTLELFVNHELAEGEAFGYTLENGLVLTGARITKFLIDVGTREIISAQCAYERIYDRTGALVTSAPQVNEGTSPNYGIDRMCSASLFKAGTYGLVDDLFITGEEAVNGQAYVLDVDNADLYAAPWLGRAKWENATFLRHDDPAKVALLIGDDTQAAPLYLYVGEKDHNGDGGFLDRNGLAYGTLYVLVADGGLLSPEDVNGTGTRFSGGFQPIAHYDPTQAGTGGRDALGFAYQYTQYALGDAVGMFHFSRPEDLATDPHSPTRAVMASTGRGQLYPADDWGTTYIIDVDLDALRADVRILYDGDDSGGGQFNHPDEGLRSPDNLDWGLNGSIYVQEDRGTQLNNFGHTSGMEASVWKLDQITGEAQRIAMVDRDAGFPEGQYDASPSDIGNWETSGVIEVTDLFDEQDRVLLFAVVQAHSVTGGAISSLQLAIGGQLVLLEGPMITDLVLSAKAGLAGAYDQATGLMRDDLRANGLLPEQQPYAAPPYIHDGDEAMMQGVELVTGTDAVVDWVLVELRDANDPAVVLDRRAALIQRDGDIVEMDGTSPVRFNDLPAGDHHVALRHRNHLGVMTATPLHLSPMPAALDLTSAATGLYGTNAQWDSNGILLMWNGDVNNDGVIKYTGNGNDRDMVLQRVGGVVPTSITEGYHPEDLDLDGVTRYTGAGNDRDIILQSIGGISPTEQREEQLPE